MAKLTKDRIEEYVENKGFRCPYCNSLDTEPAGGFLAEDGIVTQHMKCNACDSHWSDVYQLINIHEEE